MRRRLAIEVGSWRSSLIRAAAGPEVGRRADAVAAEVASGRKSAAFGDQEARYRFFEIDAYIGHQLELVMVLPDNSFT